MDAPAAAISFWPTPTPYAQGVGPGHEPVLTAFLQPDDRPRPAIIICPGGGYCRHAPHEADPVALRFHKWGFNSFVLYYRVNPYRHPVPLSDAARAIRFIRHNAARFNIQPDEVGILGFSAGGHLACSLATLPELAQSPCNDAVDAMPARPDFLVACYPVISFGAFGHSGSRDSLLGPNPDPAIVKQLSLENSVTPANPPTFLFHTWEDPAVPVMNTLAFAESLTRCRVSTSVHVFPRGRHGVGMGEPGAAYAVWPELAGSWLTEMGFASTTGGAA